MMYPLAPHLYESKEMKYLVIETVSYLVCFRQGTELAVMQNKLGDTESQLENVKR